VGDMGKRVRGRSWGEGIDPNLKKVNISENPNV